MRRPACAPSYEIGRLPVHNQLFQDWTAFEAGLRVVENDLGHSLIERDTEQDTAFAGHQRIGVIAQTCNVGGECRHCPGLATSSPDHGRELIDTLQRLALPAGQLAEDLALVLTELFAHRRNQKCPP